MKVLFFIESLYSSGKERRLSELLKGLKDYPQIECELVLTRQYIHYKYVLDLGIKIHYIERKYLKKDPSLFYKFYKICKASKPDVIHVWGNMVSIYTIPTKILLGTPIVNSQITNVTRIKTTKYTFRFADLIIANSHAGLTAYDAPRHKSRCIHNGFDFHRTQSLTDKSTMRERFSIATPLVVCMIASFVQNKDYPSYLQAAMKILDQRSDVTFLCVGNRDDTPYRNMVAEKYNERILFLGKQDNVESIINICDIGVLSTFTEGLSNSIMEFMAFGKPVVATDGGGTSELIDDKVTGFLVPQRSPYILAEQISRLISDDNLRKEMGANGEKRIRESFNLEEKVNAYVEAYKELIA